MQVNPAQVTERIKSSKVWYDVVEVVTMSQFDELEELMRAMHQEIGPFLPFDFEVIKKRAKQSIEDVERKWFNIWAAYREGEPVGFLVGYISPFYFCDELGSQTQFWFVQKRLRGTPVPFLLLREFVKWQALRGCIRCMIDISTQGNAHKFGRMAEKLGFKPSGAYFVRDHYNG